MTLDGLRGKKIGMVGMGVNNQHLAQYLKAHGIQFQIIDNWTTPDDLIGKLDEFEVIFRTPGLPYLSQAVQQAKSKGVEISSQTKLFFDLCPVQIIGVTGTKGKGTTSSLIAKILETTGYKAWLGGNIGKDPFEFLDQIERDDFVVLELSSFQLQDMERSPQVAVVLNISPDHLNHHESMEEYLQAKSQILAYQAENDVAVLNQDLPDSFKSFGKGKKIFFSSEQVSDFQTKLLGKHNFQNIAAAVNVGLVYGVDGDYDLRKAVSEFEPLPHRLNPIRELNGIQFVDDAFSTNVEPTIAAISAFEKPIVLIVGGFDKGQDFTKLGEHIKSSKHLKGVVVIGQVAPKILAVIQGYKGKIITGGKNLKEIVNQALSIADKKGVVVFSPGTSSFDMFKDETDRGEQFVKVVKEL